MPIHLFVYIGMMNCDHRLTAMHYSAYLICNRCMVKDGVKHATVINVAMWWLGIQVRNCYPVVSSVMQDLDEIPLYYIKLRFDPSVVFCSPGVEKCNFNNVWAAFTILSSSGWWRFPGRRSFIWFQVCSINSLHFNTHSIQIWKRIKTFPKFTWYKEWAKPFIIHFPAFTLFPSEVLSENLGSNLQG